MLAWAPYLLAMNGVWRLRRWRTRESAYDRVTSATGSPLYVGRRLLDTDIAPDGLAFVVDLTSEFQERRILRDVEGYRTIPTLDGHAPTHETAFQHVVEEVAAAEDGGVYIHCAYGHGRAALTTAAVLIARSNASSAETAVAQVKAARAGTRLTGAQMRWLERFTSRVSAANGGKDAKPE